MAVYVSCCFMPMRECRGEKHDSPNQEIVLEQHSTIYELMFASCLFVMFQ
jgi:hypothetical protein